MDFEHQWAVALQKAKNKQKIPLSAQKDNLIDRIKDKKKALLLAFKTRNSAKIQNLYKDLVDLRARQLAMQIRLEKEKNIIINETILGKYLSNYAKECKTLAKTVGVFLK